MLFFDDEEDKPLIQLAVNDGYIEVIEEEYDNYDPDEVHEDAYNNQDSGNDTDNEGENLERVAIRRPYGNGWTHKYKVSPVNQLKGKLKNTVNNIDWLTTPLNMDFTDWRQYTVCLSISYYVVKPNNQLCFDCYAEALDVVILESENITFHFCIKKLENIVLECNCCKKVLYTKCEKSACLICMSGNKVIRKYLSLKEHLLSCTCTCTCTCTKKSQLFICT